MTSLGLGAGVLFRTNEKKITGARRRRLLIRSLTFLVRNNLYWGRTSRPRIHPVGFLLFLLLYQSALSIPLHPCQQNIYLQSELSQHILKGKKNILRLGYSLTRMIVFLFLTSTDLIKTVVQSLLVIICKIHERFF